MQTKKIIMTCLVLTLVSGSSLLQAAETTPQEQAQEILRSNDLDKDGKLSMNEVDLSFKLRRFKKVDLNADRFLDEAELTQSYQNSALAKRQQPPQSDNPLTDLFKKATNLKDSDQRYTVEQGDSLYSISKKYNVQIEDLKKINQIQDETLVPIGKVLIIPQNSP